MANTAITYPPVLINEYLAEKVLERIPERFYGPLRFFPTFPVDIDAVVAERPEQSYDVFGVYGRMLGNRGQPFPHVKKEQTIYHLYKMSGDPEGLIETVQVIHDLLDRGDESAQEVNAWVSSKVNGDLITFGTNKLARDFKPVLFHEVKVMQLEEGMDIAVRNSTRTFTAEKIIVEYKYHTQNYS
jgi:hypothetical protein